MSPESPPLISVVMATYNGARYIEASIASMLAQTLGDFELIIADDCSTDDTLERIARFDDPRIRVLRNERNMGVVASRNRCFAAARGRFVAMLDHDDISRPQRLALQVGFLELNPGVNLVGTAAHTLSDGVLTPTRHLARTTPLLIRWLLLIDNPLVCSSVMFRSDAVRSLGCFMREEMTYADDYDLYHRLLPLGEIGRLDEYLTLYRLHQSNTFRAHEERMAGNAVKALTGSYTQWFGDGAAAAASLVVRHLMGGRQVPDLATMAALRDVVTHLRQSFLAEHGPSPAERRAIDAASDAHWRRVLRRSKVGLGAGPLPSAVLDACRYPSGAAVGWADRLGTISARLPGRSRAARMLGEARAWVARRNPPPTAARMFGEVYDPVPVDPGDPPKLYVVVDTEAEFDWAKPFANTLVSVTAMDDVERGQAVFDRYGLRPIYVVDYPVATQQRSVEALRRILERSGCFIGVHLHPWTNPPFRESFTAANSFPGNLPAELEAEKITALVEAIRGSFGIDPLFYKAGRYGLGRDTHLNFDRHGIAVDLSVLPETDLRSTSGPDFSAMQGVPYRLRGGAHVTVPVTRESVGLLPSLNRQLRRVFGPRLRTRLRIQAALSRLRLSDTITLTPEGVSAEEQVRLIKAMIRKGRRTFVMHYHSPSLSPGHTPYVRTVADAERFVQRIEQVCRFFFEELAGMPGHPPDLARMAAATSVSRGPGPGARAASPP